MSESFTCLALVKPASGITREWKLAKPGYCIYEYTAWAVNKHEIRWGDGSWQELDEKDLNDLILLHQFDATYIDSMNW